MQRVSMIRLSVRSVFVTLLLMLAAEAVPASAQQAEARELPGDPQEVAIDGIRLHYVDQGSGETMVLVHGTLQDYTAWLPHVEVFDDRYQVIAYSRRHAWPNQNTGASTDYSARQDAQDLAGLIEALELGRVHLVGLSYGALTSLILAIERPDLVRTLVLAEPPINPEPLGLRALPAREKFPRYAELMRQGQARAAVELFFREVVGRERVNQIPETAWEQVMLNVREFRALMDSSQPFPPVHPGKLAEIRQPTLTIVGAANVGTHHESFNDALVRHIPGAEAVTIPEATHFMWYEQPELTRRAVLDFLERWATDGAGGEDL